MVQAQQDSLYRRKSNSFLVPVQVFDWKSFLLEGKKERCEPLLKGLDHSFGVSPNRHASTPLKLDDIKVTVRGLRERLLSIYESIRLHFLLNLENHRQSLHAAVGFFCSFH